MAKKSSASRNVMNIFILNESSNEVKTKEILNKIEECIAAKNCNEIQLKNLIVLRDSLIGDIKE